MAKKIFILKDKGAGLIEDITADDLLLIEDTTESSIPTEEKISGTREDWSGSGTKQLDWENVKVYRITMTDDTTLEDLNLPVDDNTKILEIIITGDYILTLPAYWEAEPSNDTYDGTSINRILVDCVKGNTPDRLVTYSLQNL